MSAPTKTEARARLLEMLNALKEDRSDQYWDAFNKLNSMHNSLRGGFRWGWAARYLDQREYRL